ncbi:kinase-like protein, partial [Hyaloscypha variabilis F]
WQWRDINDFCHAQWAFLAPVFDELHKHYELDDNDILPFIEDNEKFLRQGGYSEVWGVRIHQAHQLLRQSSASGKEHMFAIKRLFSADSDEFKRETEMLKALSKLKHRHVLQLLATYKFRGRYHLVFPYAKHNLRELWNCIPNVDDIEWVAWSLRQMLGIASGLMQVHCFRPGEARSSILPKLAPEDDLMSLVGSEERYGRHGDIKPENILWFDDMDDNTKQGLLVIADFGLASFHGRETRSKVRPETIGGTLTYAPPEVELHSKISRAYDIWSLGCVFLEFIIWLLDGSQHLQAFCEDRMEECADGVSDDAFYTLFHDKNPASPKAIVRRGVQSWIKALHDHPRCSGLFHDLLDLISERMLSVEPDKRISSKQLNEELSRMVEKATRDPSYLIEPKVHPSESLERPKAEMQQVTASSRCTDLIKFNPTYVLGSDLSLRMLDIARNSRSSFVSTDSIRWGRNSPALA